MPIRNANPKVPAEKKVKPNPSPSPTPKARFVPLGDYVPCMFTQEEIQEFRLVPWEKSVKEATNATIKSLNLNPDDEVMLVGAVNKSDFLLGQGMTELSDIFDEIKESKDTDPEKAKVEDAKKKTLEKTTEKVAAVKEDQQDFRRPNDISCSISIFPWDVSHDDFGRHVANKMTAIQVTVRNLNQNDEFLMHDVQIAVDTYPGQYNRFQAGVNQPALRGIASIGQDVSIRSRAVRIAEFLGAIAASSSIPGSNDFKNGVAVYTGAFLPAFNKLLGDHTVEQVGRLDEMSFSANNTRRIVVPTRSSVTFVTFIPSQPLEFIDFGCLYQVGVGVSKPEDCNGTGTVKRPWLGPLSSGQTADMLTYLRLKPKHYKSWSPIDLLALQNSTFVIVAGAHVKEQPSVATLQSLDCKPKTSDGTLDLTSNEAVTCTLTGDQLQLAGTITLKNTANSNDTNVAVGKVSVSGDPKTAEVTFKREDLNKLTGADYTVFFAGKDGVAKSSPVHLKIKPGPKATIKPTEIDLGKLSDPVPFEVSGTNIAKGDTLELLDDKSQAVVSATVADVNDTKKTATAKFAADDLKRKLKAGEFTVGFVPKGGKPDDKPQIIDGLKIKVTGAAPPGTTPTKPQSKATIKPSGINLDKLSDPTVFEISGGTGVTINKGDTLALLDDKNNPVVSAVADADTAKKTATVSFAADDLKKLKPGQVTVGLVPKDKPDAKPQVIQGLKIKITGA
jgi:hypothetical protein